MKLLSENHEIMSRTIWSSSPQLNLLFNSIKMPAAIYEVGENEFSALRVNKSYNDLFSDGMQDNLDTACEKHLSPQSRQELLRTFRRAAETKCEASCSCAFVFDGDDSRVMNMEVQYWGTNGNMRIVFATMSVQQE